MTNIKKNISMNFLSFNDDSRNSNFFTTIREQQNRRNTKVNKSCLLCDLRGLKPENFFPLKKKKTPASAILSLKYLIKYTGEK
jgi:hypothetical protein